MRPAFASFMDDFPIHIGTLANALADDQLLLGVIMTATAGDEQRLDGLVRAQGQGRGKQEKKGEFFHKDWFDTDANNTHRPVNPR